MFPPTSVARPTGWANRAAVARPLVEPGVALPAKVRILRGCDWASPAPASARTREKKSGMGLPHSRTLARVFESFSLRKVLECGSPMPLLTENPLQQIDI